MILFYLQTQREEPRPPPPDQDFDLDSLLSDLTSFNPSETVAARNPPPPPPRRDFPHASPSHSSHSSRSTPVHNHSTPTPPRCSHPIPHFTPYNMMLLHLQYPRSWCWGSSPNSTQTYSPPQIQHRGYDGEASLPGQSSFSLHLFPHP